MAAATLTGIEPIDIQDEMERSFLDYAMSVIVSRALPDVRDGLKPVHRRLLYGMHDMGDRPDRPHLKCARVTGDVMGRYHPHGDLALYDALVRMAQPFSLRHPLVDGHGNFGSLDDGPAAARYTECRLSQIATHLLDGIDQDTVDFEDNYSGEYESPDRSAGPVPQPAGQRQPGHRRGHGHQHPARTTCGEVIDATIHLIDHPEATPDDLMQFVKGPDFPTGGYILGRQGIMDAYRTGRGSIKMRAKAEIVETTQRRHADRGHRAALPGQPAAVLTRIKELVDTRELEGIRDANDASAKGLDPDRDRAQARRQRQRGAQQPLQAHPAADQLRRQHGRPGRRRAPDPQPGPGPRGLRRPPGRGHPAPVRVPAPTRPGTGPTSSRD